MQIQKQYILNEGFNLKLTCHVKTEHRQPIVWRKDGIILNDKKNASFQLVETPKSSMLSLKQLKPTDAGNYSCQSSSKSGSSNKWIYIQVNSKDAIVAGSRAVADEPQKKCHTMKCGPNEACSWNEISSTFQCVSKSSNQNVSPWNPEKRKTNDFLSGLHIPQPDPVSLFSHLSMDPGSNSKYDEILVKDANYEPFEETEFESECDSISGICDTHASPPLALIGIGTLCGLFLTAVVIAGFIIRRKILRQQRIHSIQNFHHNLVANSTRRCDENRNANWTQLKELRTPVLTNSYTSLQTTALGNLFSTPERNIQPVTLIGGPPVCTTEAISTSTFQSTGSPVAHDVVFIEQCLPGDAIFLIKSTSLDCIPSPCPLPLLQNQKQNQYVT